MATLAAPYGMRPVSLVGGRVYSGSFRQYPIASAYATNIFAGDLVDLAVDGTIERETADVAVTTVGIFMGVSYTDATMGSLHRQYWPASQVATDAMAYVCDDPFAVFECQADATLGQNSVGSNFALAGDADGSTTTGNSGVVVSASSINTTNTLPLRVIGFWDPDEIDSDFPNMLVTWNTTAAHRYLQILGIAAS